MGGAWLNSGTVYWGSENGVTWPVKVRLPDSALSDPDGGLVGIAARVEKTVVSDRRTSFLDAPPPPNYIPSGAANIICGVSMGDGQVTCGIPVAKDPATGAPFVMNMLNMNGGGGGGAARSQISIIKDLASLLARQQRNDSMMKALTSIAKSVVEPG